MANLSFQCKVIVLMGVQSVPEITEMTTPAPPTQPPVPETTVITTTVVVPSKWKQFWNPHFFHLLII